MTYEEFKQLEKDHPTLAKWTCVIAANDDRPAHPEDYVDHAKRLLRFTQPSAIFHRIQLLRNHPECHTPNTYSFLDFFELIVGR
jgi:hypothetical protein